MLREFSTYLVSAVNGEQYRSNKEHKLLSNAAYITRLLYMGDIAPRLQSNRSINGWQTTEERRLVWKELASDQLAPFQEQIMAVRGIVERANEVREENPVFVSVLSDAANLPDIMDDVSRNFLTDVLISRLDCNGRVSPSNVTQTVDSMAKEIGGPNFTMDNVAALKPDVLFAAMLANELKFGLQS